jgi:hypothetical protein
MSKKELGAALDDIMSAPTPTAPMGRKEAEKERLRRLPKKTVPVTFRIPKTEVARLERVFSEEGLTMAAGVRRAVYEYARKLQEGKR